MNSLVLIGIVGGGVVLLMIAATLARALVKADAGQAIVKTGFGMSQPSVSLSSAIALPLLHRVDTLDLTVKTVRIARREHESLSCADGIRAEVEVDFYIKINAVEEDIRHVASTIGCDRASDIEILRELFEAKFADALKTAGAMLKFDQLYQNRIEFRDEILQALGQEGGQDVVLNGYKLDDVAIQYLEQLPLDLHNEDNVLDSRGRKEIAERTSHEVEAANKRLRQKEVTIAEQDQEARVRQLEIAQDIAEKEAAQQREIQEAQATEKARTEKTVAEQDQIAEEARILKERRIRVAEEEREQEVASAEIRRQRAVELANEERQQEIENARIRRMRAVSVSEQDKLKAIEIARIQREADEAEALKAKLVKLEETAKQEAEKIRAEEQAETVRALERANRTKQIEVIEAEQVAAVEREQRQVEADVKSYEIRTVAQAELEAAELDAQAAEKKALAIERVGQAEASARAAALEAENLVNQRVILANALEELIPLLPDLVERLMIPAEKIDSIRVLNVSGMPSMNGLAPSGAAQGDGAPQNVMQNGSLAGSILGTVLNVGALLPVLREVMRGLQGQDDYEALVRQIKSVPGGQTLLRSLERPPAKPPAEAPTASEGDAAPDVAPNAPTPSASGGSSSP